MIFIFFQFLKGFGTQVVFISLKTIFNYKKQINLHEVVVMKKLLNLMTLAVITLLLTAGSLFAQQRDLQYYTAPDQRGLNEFEAPFYTDIEFDGLYVRIGGANTLQFQGLSQENDANSVAELESNFNLATSNLDLDVALANGVRMHLRTYLSSQHHPEAWVKGGYLQVDRLDFISEDFAADLMDNLRFKVGHMEINYGDAHFRRTDNAQAIYNPFVGNYLMDSFSTEVAGEVYYFNGGFMAMLGLSNGKLNQSTIDSDPRTSPNFYAKLAYDKQINDNTRFRLSGSFITSGETAAFYLYSGDRAGGRYYNVIEGSDFAGRWDPGYTVSRFNPAGPIGADGVTSYMINPFVKLGGFEFFGVLEGSSGKLIGENDDRNSTQIGLEALYRFGASENFYLGGRYNTVNSDFLASFTPGTPGLSADVQEVTIDRINIGGGWFMTQNILTKFEYVSQSYSDFPTGALYRGAEFNGFMIEAVISF